MAWFKCSMELLNRPEFMKIFMPISSHDSNSGSRIACIVKVLCQSASGQYYKDSRHMMTMTGVTMTQAECVWDTLIQEGVLRLEKGVYSAISWLFENGYMAKEGSKDSQTRRTNRAPNNSNARCERRDENIVDGEAAEKYKAELLRIVGSK